MNTEELRRRYRPETIRALFVGESPPAGGTFFYAANSNLYRFTEQAFRDALGNQVGLHFLAAFRDLGCYLDDLCHMPVNRMTNPQRRAARLAGEGPLAERIRLLTPRVVVGIGYGCEPNFVRAHHAADLDAPLHILPFPNWPQQRADYVEQLTTLVRQSDQAGLFA